MGETSCKMDKAILRFYPPPFCEPGHKNATQMNVGHTFFLLFFAFAASADIQPFAERL